MDNQLFWEKYFQTYDILNEAIPYQQLMDDLIGALQAHKGNLILDAGSGTGNLCIKLKKFGSKPIGFDFSKEAIKIHLCKDQSATVFHGDLTDKLPFPDNFFDSIVSNNVIYTINKDVRLTVIREFYRILKFDGRIVIANVHVGFNPLLILWDHLEQSRRTKGILHTIVDLPRKANAVVKMFYYLLCKKMNKSNYYYKPVSAIFPRQKRPILAKAT
jgi:ubiquinone/menaquinone biosynthesis C-methylase UbiE